jgi:hypothetical protein
MQLRNDKILLMFTKTSTNTSNLPKRKDFFAAFTK